MRISSALLLAALALPCTPALGASSVDDKVAAAQAAKQAGDFAAMEAALREVLVQRPLHPRWTFHLAVARAKQGATDAAITLLAPDHPALNQPNRLGPADFSGWVQERGLYFPTEWDSRYTALLACADPGEAPKNGSLLVACHGKGHFVYTGLAFFRQLPAGVPGAYRLLANLVSLGK